MKKWKSRLTVILLFGFLCVIALIPMVLTEIENQRFLGKARVEHVPENSMIGREKNINVDTMTKLKTIIAAQTNITGSVTDQMKVELEQEEIDQLVASLKEQLVILQRKKAIPLFEISSDYEIQYFSRRTLMDSKNPNIYVSIWDLDFLFGNYYIKAYMDTETNQIFQIRVMTRGDVSMDLSDIKFTNYLDYLGISKSQVAWDVGENLLEYKYYQVDETEGSADKVKFFCYIDSGYLEYTIQVYTK